MFSTTRFTILASFAAASLTAIVFGQEKDNAVESIRVRDSEQNVEITVAKAEFAEIEESLNRVKSVGRTWREEFEKWLAENPGTEGGQYISPPRTCYELDLLNHNGEYIDVLNVKSSGQLISPVGSKEDVAAVQAWVTVFFRKIRTFGAVVERPQSAEGKESNAGSVPE